MFLSGKQTSFGDGRFWPIAVIRRAHARVPDPIHLESGEERRFLEDGDELILSARTPPSQKFAQIGFGECRGRVCVSPAAQ